MEPDERAIRAVRPAWNDAVNAVVTTILIGAALVVPFAVLQWIHRRSDQAEFPLVLFAFMTLHALLIAVSLVPALGRLRSERTLRALTPRHWTGLLLCAVLTFVYVQVIADQLPCFLGVPNCD